MKELLLALILISPVVIIGYGHAAEIVQIATNIFGPVLHALMGAIG